MEDELREMEFSIQEFNEKLTSELIRDGILEKGETVENVEIEDGEIRKVNGKKFKPADPDKYKDLVTRYLKGTKGHLKWHN